MMPNRVIATRSVFRTALTFPLLVRVMFGSLTHRLKLFIPYLARDGGMYLAGFVHDCLSVVAYVELLTELAGIDVESVPSLTQ